MPDNGAPSHYMSYLLRVWGVAGQGPRGLRALLENIATGERAGFSDLAGLVAFLEQQAAGPTGMGATLPDALDETRSYMQLTPAEERSDTL